MQLRDVILSGGPAPLRYLGGGEEGLRRPVLAAVTIDLPDPGRFVSPGDLVLSGLVWLRPDLGRADAFVRIVVEAGAVALGAGEAEFGNVPDELVRACDRHGLPLFAVGVDVPFGPVAEFVARGRSGARVGNLAALVDRHRRLMASRPGSGAGTGALLELLLSELDLRAHVLSPTGRLIAGARPPLPERTATALAGRFLAAERSGRRAPHRTAAQGQPYSLFPVRSAPGAGPALTDWAVAVEADSGDWHDERIGLVERLAGLIAAERGGPDADRTARRRAAGRLLGLLDSDATGARARERVRDAAGLLAAEAPGGGARWQAVAARLDGVPGGDGPSPVRDLLEEVLLHPACLGPGAARRIGLAAALDGREAVAFVRVAGGAELTPEAVREAACGALPRGLRGGERLSLGLGDPVAEPDDLRHTLAEARGARRVAAGPEAEPVAVRGTGDMAAHVMSLLPLLPAEVRRAFSRRLLAPLHAYDRRHQSELVPTLRSFLEHDGSWARCGEALHLHVNSLRYRITRIESLTGRDLARLEDKMDFAAALRMD